MEPRVYTLNHSNIFLILFASLTNYSVIFKTAMFPLISKGCKELDIAIEGFLWTNCRALLHPPLQFQRGIEAAWVRHTWKVLKALHSWALPRGLNEGRAMPHGSGTAFRAFPKFRAAGSPAVPHPSSWRLLKTHGPCTADIGRCLYPQPALVHWSQQASSALSPLPGEEVLMHWRRKPGNTLALAS